MSDHNYYERLYVAPDKSTIINLIKEILCKHNKLYYTNNSDTNYTPLAKYVLNSEYKKSNLAKFYINLKIHKTPMMGRPICSSLGTITHNASILLDKWLQPLAKKSKFYVKNSIEFILELEEKTYLNNCYILTADVVNLYPSIVISDGLVQLKRALTIDNAPPDMINLILDMCKWVLENNIIQFGDTIWRQKKGTAMGTPVAVCFSIIYLAMLEIDYS